MTRLSSFRRVVVPVLIGLTVACGSDGDGGNPMAPSANPITASLDPVAPGASSANVTFAVRGVVGRDCHVCGVGSAQFGTGIPAGTPLAATFTFDPRTPPTPTFEPNRVDYFGVSVLVTVGSASLSGNDPSMAKIQIADGPPYGDSYSLIVDGGFRTGSIAGVSIDHFIWVVSGPSSLFLGTDLPVEPFALTRLGSRVCIGNCFRGRILEGRIDSLTDRERNAPFPISGDSFDAGSGTVPATNARTPRLPVGERDLHTQSAWHIRGVVRSPSRRRSWTFGPSLPDTTMPWPGWRSTDGSSPSASRWPGGPAGSWFTSSEFTDRRSESEHPTSTSWSVSGCETEATRIPMGSGFKHVGTRTAPSLMSRPPRGSGSVCAPATRVRPLTARPQRSVSPRVAPRNSSASTWRWPSNTRTTSTRTSSRRRTTSTIRTRGTRGGHRLTQSLPAFT